MHSTKAAATLPLRKRARSPSRESLCGALRPPFAFRSAPCASLWHVAQVHWRASLPAPSAGLGLGAAHFVRTTAYEAEPRVQPRVRERDRRANTARSPRPSPASAPSHFGADGAGRRTRFGAMPRGTNTKRTSRAKRRGPRVGWDDLPGELHFEILRLVPLCDATAARQVSREMRDKVDETWRAWGIRATADELVSANYPANWRMREAELECGPLAVFRFDGSHRHHLMCLGLKWQAQLVAWEEQEVDINRSLWFDEECEDFSLLLVAVRARRPAERGADGAVEWEYVLRDEVVKVVKAALEKSGAEEYMKEHWYCNMGVDWHRRDMRPLLSQCAMRGCLGAVKACLDAGAQVDADSPSNLRYWMDGDPPEEPSSRLSRGDIFDFTMYWPALVLAARAGHETVVEALLEAGASAQIGWHGEDWTFPAVCGGQPTAGILRPLAEAGADVDAVPSYPEWCRFEMPAQYPTALMIAARDKRLDMAQTLVELGADVNDVACCGHTVMHMAADGEVVRWLAARGGEVSGDSFDGWPPLQSACGGGRVDAARALIELGAEVDGDSLMWAVGVRDEENAVEITRMLLAAGANPEGYGLQPQHAIRHPGCVDLLVEAGADLEALDCFEKTPIYSAVKHLLREEELVAPDKRHDWGAVVLRLADLGADLINTGGEPGLVKRKVEELRRQRAAECGGDSCAAD